MSVLLIRHTQVGVAPGLCYGRTDVPLAATFAREAEDVCSRLPWTPLIVWCSPATRCRRLAERLAGPGLAVRVDGRLAELDFGEWESRRWDDFRGPESEAWALDPMHRRPPCGETGLELLARVQAFRNEVSGADANRFLVVTHAGVIRAWQCLEAGVPFSMEPDAIIPCGGIVAVDRA